MPLRISIPAQILLLIALIFTAYSNTLDHTFVWDDLELILTNVRVHSLRFIPLHFTGAFFESSSSATVRGRICYWRPLTLLSFNLDFFFWGEDPFGYHLTNILIHSLNAILVLMMLRAFPGSRPAAFFAALLFALHPLQTNAVSYISGRTDLLATGFFLLGCILFTRCVTAQKNESFARAGLFLCLALSFLSKESSLAAPLLLLLLICLIDRPRLRHLGAPLAVAFAVTALYIVIRAVVVSPLTGGIPLRELISLRHLPAVAESLIIYGRLVLLPVGLHMERFISAAAPLTPYTLFCASLVLLILCITVRALSQKRPASVFFLWSLAALLPASNIIPLYRDIAAEQLFLGEQFLYLPLIGLSAAAAILFVNSAKRPGGSSSAFFSAGALILVLMAMLTYHQNDYWRDELTFYSRTLQHYPGSVRMSTNLGLLHARQGNLDESLRLLSMVADQNPLSARAHSNLGAVYHRMGKLVRARAELRRAIELDPRLAKAHGELGLIDMRQGRLDEAIASFRTAIAVAPLSIIPRVNCAAAFMKRGDLGKAVATLRDALSIDPRSIEARYLLATAYEREGRSEEAAQQYRELLRYYPDLRMAVEKVKKPNN